MCLDLVGFLFVCWCAGGGREERFDTIFFFYCLVNVWTFFVVFPSFALSLSSAIMLNCHVKKMGSFLISSLFRLISHKSNFLSIDFVVVFCAFRAFCFLSFFFFLSFSVFQNYSYKVYLTHDLYTLILLETPFTKFSNALVKPLP